MRTFLISRVCCALLLLLAVSLAGCEDKGKGAAPRPFIAVVSVEQVMRDSKAGKAGREHLAAVTATLQKGWDELRAVAEQEPEDQRKETLSRGLATLRRREGIEEAAVARVVREAMLAEIAKYRQGNPHILVVVSRENLLDVAGELDITQAVIKGMEGRDVTFAALPDVQVKPGEPARPAAEEADAREGKSREKASKPRRDDDEPSARKERGKDSSDRDGSSRGKSRKDRERERERDRDRG